MYYSYPFYRCANDEQINEFRDPQILDLIIEAMKGERSDRAKYGSMMNIMV